MQQIVALFVQHVHAFGRQVAAPRRAHTREVRTQRHSIASQRGMLVLVGVTAELQPLHADGQVPRLIERLVERGVGGRDARHRHGGDQCYGPAPQTPAQGTVSR